jgi:hypothetical protein
VSPFSLLAALRAPRVPLRRAPSPLEGTRRSPKSLFVTRQPPRPRSARRRGPSSTIHRGTWSGSRPRSNSCHAERVPAERGSKSGAIAVVGKVTILLFIEASKRNWRTPAKRPRKQRQLLFQGLAAARSASSPADAKVYRPSEGARKNRLMLTIA